MIGLEIVAGLLFVVVWILNKRRQVPWWLTLTLLALGGLAFAASALGGLLGGLLVGIAEAVGAMFSSFGVAINGAGILGALSAVALLIIILDVAYDRVVNKPATIAMIAFPILSIYAGGLVGQLGDAARSGGASAAQAFVSALIG